MWSYPIRLLQSNQMIGSYNRYLTSQQISSIMSKYLFSETLKEEQRCFP